jgi:hypothetical protein
MTEAERALLRLLAEDAIRTERAKYEEYLSDTFETTEFGRQLEEALTSMNAEDPKLIFMPKPPADPS